MIEKVLDEAEASAQLINSLRDGYAGDPHKALKDCAFSEQAIAYAFEELAPDAQQSMEEHLEHCRTCMDLILDTRTAEIESCEQAKQAPRVLPALSDAVSQPRRASFIEKIVGGTFMTFKIIAAPVAVVCFMLILSRLDVLNSVHFTTRPNQISEISQPITRKIPAVQPAGKRRTAASGASTQENPTIVNSFSMHEGWSVDPFEPAMGDRSRQAVKKKVRPRTPLETLDPSQLKLVGVMLSDKGNKAIVEDASGKGHVIREGTYIGTN
ncbi:MAG: pilus assembly protein PilP, partial [Desulfobacterales bacterium]|nr:pilus assembly protein PilP [Desulfobacterales bacterium]